mgnify:CR=1 FL=1
MAVEKESSVDFVPETIEEEYALLAGRLKAAPAVQEHQPEHVSNLA